jgi:SAM-dependent methyltransferase
LSGRPAYPAQLVADVLRLTNITLDDHVLDLGCGPGQLALAFAPFVRSILAIDPEPEMLALCQSELRLARCTNVETRLGSSYDLGSSLGEYKAVLIGRAFHWMDRSATLLNLDRTIESNGAVILFGDVHPQLAENAWLADFEQIIDRFADVDPGRQLRKSANWIRHEAVLLDSPFCQLERISVIVRQSTSCASLIERALSRSSTTAARLGERAIELVTDLQRRFAEKGSFTEIVEIEALIARRSS